MNTQLQTALDKGAKEAGYGEWMDALGHYKDLPNNITHALELNKIISRAFSLLLEEAKEGMWISVKDGLPPNENAFSNDTVLFLQGTIVRLGCYDYETGFWEEMGGGNYIDIESYMKDKITGGHVTHWKHLPKPPTI